MTKPLIMNNKVQYGIVLDDCKSGNFEKTLEYIINMKGNLNSNIALKILIGCCNACVSFKDRISKDYLMKLLKSLWPHFKDLTEVQIVSYVQCLYHIIKFLIQKGALEIINEIEDIIIPNFLPLELSEKCKELYYSIAKLLYNVSVKLAVEDNCIQRDKIFKISMLMLKICIHFLDFATTVHLSVNCLNNMTFVKLSVEYQIQFYKELLNLIPKSLIETQHEEVVKLILMFSSGILCNILSTSDFKKGLEFLQKIDGLVCSIFNWKELSDLHQILKFVFILSPLKLEDKYSEFNKCKESLRNLDKAWNKSESRKTFFYYIIELLQTLKDFYLKVSSVEWLLFSEDLQLIFFKFIEKFYYFFISEKTPGDLNENMYSGLSCTGVIISLLKITNQNGKHSLEYQQASLDILEKFLSHIKLLKMQNFDKWNKAWTILAVQIYNSGKELHQKSDPAADHYFNLLFQYLMQLEEPNEGTMFLNYSVLRELCAALIKVNSKDNKKCLAFIALGVFLCVDSRDYFMPKWANLKYNLKEKSGSTEDLQKLTLVSALKEIPEVCLDVSNKISLLTTELDHYKKIWKSKVSIVSALSELFELSDNEYAANVITKIFIDMDVPNLNEFRHILARVIDGYKQLKNGTIINKINLAVLYYLQYKSCNQKSISENADAMERAESVAPPKDESNSDDPSDECNISSSFESLKLNIYKENLKNLESSLALFTSLAPDLKSDCEHVTLSQIFDLLLKISSEYKLLCFKFKAVKALEMALKIAQMRNNAPNIIKVIGFIIELAGLEKPRTRQLMETADKLLEEESFSKIDHLELTIMYYTCKSRALLYSDYKESYKIFKKGKDLLKHVGDKSSFGVVKSRLFLLNSDFCFMPCNLGIENHSKSLLIYAYSATEIMYEEYKHSKFGDADRMLSLIQASKELIKLYHYLKWPREVRTYSKEIIQLTQKLLLPIHTASYLMYLAHADLLWNDKDDCRVKLNEMGAILCLQSQPTQIGEAATYSQQRSPSSPALALQSFQTPDTAHHKSECDCFYCACDEYQTLVMENIRISALLNVKEKNLKLVQAYFQGALNLYNVYVQKHVKNRDSFADLFASYGCTLLNYSSHLWKTNRKSEAKSVIDTLFKHLDAKKNQYIHLYNEALVLKLCYLTENIIPELPAVLQDNMERLQICDSELPKTPENNQSVVSISFQSPKFASPRRIKKPPPLIFSPNEPVKKPVEKTPPLKIKIYTEGSERKSKRKVISTPLQAHPATENLPIAASVSDSLLETRTKLLTEKLKRSTRKTDQSISNIENEARGDNDRRKYPVCKKLLQDLSTPGCEQKSVGKGAVRRSARKNNLF